MSVVNSKKLYIHTIGCQMNVYDTERMAMLLSRLRYRRTDRLESADLIVVNTCAIRAKAEQKVFSFLGRLARLKQNNPGLIIAAGGCVAQQEGARMLERAPYLDVVFGTHAIGRLARIIERVEKEKCRIVDIDMSAGVEEFDTIRNFRDDGQVTSFVTIMQGCDNYCTYCVVPHVRGPEASRRPEKIVAEIKDLVRSGIREVTLLGQNVNSYGQKEGWCDFAALLQQINRIDGLLRIRFTTSHPKDLSPELCRAFKHLDKLCHHIHLPVQSGSNRVLQRMNRKYTREQYLDRIEQLRSNCPDIAITSDFIVGFPGERQADFDQTLALIRQVAFDGIFAFKYSDRPSAPARQFQPKLPEEVKNERLQILLDIQDEITLGRNQSLVGTVQQVLVEGHSKRNVKKDIDLSPNSFQWTGRTSTNKIVNFLLDGSSAKDSPAGALVRVEIEKALAHSLWGRPTGVDTTPTYLKGERSYAA